MSEQNVIPFNGIVDERFRCEDTPLIIGALSANQLSAIILLIVDTIMSKKGQKSWISLLGLTNSLKIERKDVIVDRVVQHSFEEA